MRQIIYRRGDMDIFDVLKAISKRKAEFVRIGIKESDAIKKAEYDVSNEYHIPLRDIKKLYGAASY